MKHRGLITLAVLSALIPFGLFATVRVSAGLSQSVKIDPVFAVGFTSKEITRINEFSQNLYNESYEHVLSAVKTAPGDSSKTIITNTDNPLYLSVVTNTNVKIHIEVGKVNGKKVLTNGDTGEIPLYIYNDNIINQLEKTNKEFDVKGGSYRAISYPLIVYVFESDVKAAPGGDYHGTIGVTISAM